jgi:hypothetical protein
MGSHAEVATERDQHGRVSDTDEWSCMVCQHAFAFTHLTCTGRRDVGLTAKAVKSGHVRTTQTRDSCPSMHGVMSAAT